MALLSYSRRRAFHRRASVMLKTCFSLSGYIGALLVLAIGAQAAAQESATGPEIRRTPAHTPDWTSPGGSDPGTTDSVAEDLQKIVVLCATSEPGSREFASEWRNWLRKHHQEGDDVNATINDVLRRADTYRRQAGQSPRDTASRQKLSRSMRDTARFLPQRARK